MRWALFAAILLVGGCLAPAAYPRLPEGSEAAIPTWVVDHGWHTAIVVRRDDVDRALWPEVDDFPEATFIEVATLSGSPPTSMTSLGTVGRNAGSTTLDVLL